MRSHSTYKIFGGFGLMLLLNLLSAFIVWVVIKKLATISFNTNIWNDNGILFAITFSSILEGTFLALFMTQCRYIVVDNEKITFINPLFPFIKKTKRWSDYSYYQTIEEYSRWGTYEAVWLIKDNKLKDRISSFYYSNYETLRREIKRDYKGVLSLTPFEQLWCLFGLRIKIAPDSD